MSISIKNAVKSYDGIKNILNNLDIQLDDTGFYAVVGRSGSGKSTLINVMSGLDTFTSGIFEYNNIDVAKNSAELRENIAVIYQDFHLLNELNVYQNIDIAVRLSGGKSDKEDIISLMRRLGISELANRKVDALSGGEKQRVAIARAYLSNKSVIVADEPTGNLDYENAKFVFEMLKEIAKEKLVIVVSHDMELVEHYIDNIYELKGGEAHQIDNKVAIDVNVRKISSLQKLNKNSQETVKCKKMTMAYYSKLTWGFLMKKKVVLVCMLIVSVISIAMFTSSFALLNYNGVDQLMQNFANNDSKFTTTGIIRDGPYLEGDEDLFDDYDDIVAKGTHNNYMDYNFTPGKMGNNALLMTLYELPSCDIGLEITAGKMPSNCDEFVLSINFINLILDAGFITDGVVTETYETVRLPADADEYDIIGRTFNFLDKEVELVGVYQDFPVSDGSPTNGSCAFFGEGLFDYLIENAPLEFYGSNVIYDKEHLQLQGDDSSIGYYLDIDPTDGWVIDESNLVDVGGKVSRMPQNVGEVILECPQLRDGRNIYSQDIGEYISFKNPVGEDYSVKIVGYYSSGFCDQSVYTTGESGKVFEAIMIEEGTCDYLATNPINFTSLAFSTEHDQEMYERMFDAGIDVQLDNGYGYLDLNDIIYMYLPAGIMLGVSIVILVMVCAICSMILLKGNFKSMAILKGLGAKSSQTALIAVMLVSTLVLITLAIGVPIAIGFNFIYNIVSDIGMAIGIVEVLVSLGSLVCAYLIAIGASTIALRKKKVVDSLRVE